MVKGRPAKRLNRGQLRRVHSARAFRAALPCGTFAMARFPACGPLGIDALASITLRGSTSQPVLPKALQVKATLRSYWAAVMAASCLMASHASAADGASVDYLQPAVLVGKVYEMGSGTNKLLFTSTRTATRSNDLVFVRCDYTYPNGAVAAREEVAYLHGEMAWSKLELRQTGEHGGIAVQPDAKNPAKEKLVFNWAESRVAKMKTDREPLQPKTLVGDMIPYFLVAHWNELSRGESVNFRLIVESRLETVGFKFVKEADVNWNGKPAIRLRMEASNFVIAQLVDPLFFTVEKAEPHRVFEYVGRVTPKLRDGSKWKDLDARTVYDWN